LSHGGFILLDNAGGDAAAAAERDAPVFRPGPDVRAALLAGGSPIRPVPLSSARLAGVLDVGGELLAESASVGGVQVDLVSVPPIPDRTVLSAGAPSRSSSRTTVIFVAIVGRHASDGLPCTLPITGHAAIKLHAAAAASPSIRGAKRGANVARRQATPGDNQP